MQMPLPLSRTLALVCTACLCAVATAQVVAPSEPAPPAGPAAVASAPEVSPEVSPAVSPAASAPTLPADSTAPDATPATTTGPVGQLKQRIEDTLDSWEDFLNELLVDALGPNYERRYRVFGQRKTVDLGKRWTLSLDERQTGRLNSAGVGIPAAGRPSRTFELTHIGKRNDIRFYNQQDGTGQENGGSVAINLADNLSLRTSGRRLHDDTVTIARTDAQMGLRYGPRELWVEGFVHHALLEDTARRQPWVDSKPSANFAGVQTQWEATPGLAFSAQHQRAIKPEMAPGDERLADARTEFGADWRPSGRWTGSRVYWREAPQLGLLSSSGVEERTTYRRVIGGEIPEGSPDGMVYAQVRHQSLVSDDDALLVLGWRHTRELAPKWQAQSLIESGIPVAGENAVRSTLLDLRIQHNDFPNRAFGSELQAVRTPVLNSNFISADFTQRLGLNTLFVTRASATELKPELAGEIPVTSGQVSVGLGWQEPEERNFSTFWRYALLGRNPGMETALPGAAKRLAHIAFSEFDYRASEDLNLLLRASRRWDRDDAINAGAERITDLVVLRSTQQIAKRWRFGFHIANLKDSVYGTERGYGAELSIQMNRKIVLALGYNAKGINDGEMSADDRLGKGFKLRAYIPTEATLNYWLRSARGEERK